MVMDLAIVYFTVEAAGKRGNGVNAPGASGFEGSGDSGRPGGPFAAGPVGRPVEFVEEHQAILHGFVPGVVGQVLGDAVGTKDDGIMAGSDDVRGDCPENARAGFAALVGVGTHY